MEKHIKIEPIAMNAQQRLHSKEFKDLLVGKGGPDGRESKNQRNLKNGPK